jgi:O-antigen ligase
MNEVIAYGFPAGLALMGMLAILVGFGAVLAWPRPLLLAFVACMVSFASSSGYGFENPGDANVFWVKGTRSFFFSFIEMGIWGAWIAMLFRQAWQMQKAAWLPTSKYYLGFGALMIGWALVGLPDPRHPLLPDLSQRGFSNIVLQGMFLSLVVSTLRAEVDLRRVTLIFLACVFSRDVFGLVRFLAFGGDPQNAYDTLGDSHVRITFWDINDSILAAAMFALCAWRVLTAKQLPTWERIFYWVAGVAALLIPLLSARRTAQFGMLLAIVALTALLPRGRRWPAVLALVLAVPVMLFALGQRSGNPGASLADRVLIDVQTDRFSDPRQSRFYELRTAWQTLKDSPLLGLGPSGRFRVTDSRGLEYHGGYYDYVHSGFGHVFLKTGLLGLVLFCGLLLAWGRYVASLWAGLRDPARGLAVAALVGLACGLPNLVVGTPISELRTMLLMGFLMALPIVCSRCSQAAPAAAGATAKAGRASGIAGVGLRKGAGVWA